MGHCHQHAKCGATVIEVALAAVLLAVVALGTGAFVSQSAGQLHVRRSHQVALELARSRLEQLVASPYATVTPTSKTYSARYISDNSGTWVVTSSDPGETLTVDGANYAITTTTRYLDVDRGTSFDDNLSSYDYLRLRVVVAFGDGAGEVVVLETSHAP